MLILLFVFSIGGGVEVNPLDSLKIQDASFWEKLSFGIGYSGGLCWTGEDLAKPFEGSPIAGFHQLPEYLGAHIYWLNSIEGSASYPLNKDWEIEVGLEYGWTKIEKHSSLSYDFKMYLFYLGLIRSKQILRISYIDSRSTKITGSQNFHYYYGKGRGGKISYCYRINKLIGLNIDLGQINYTITQDDYEYKINQCLNGISCFIGYKFNF